MAKLSDIAKHAGVAVSTVSYVLNKTGLNKVSPQTQKRILAAARELHYVPNIAGKALRKGKTYTAALLFPDINGSFAFNIIAGVESELNRHGYSMLFCRYRTPEEFADKCALLTGKSIDGVIILGCHSQYLDRVAALDKIHPVVSLAHCHVLKQIPSVYVDGKKLNFLAVKHLVEQGHRRIAVQTGADADKEYGARAAAAGSSAELIFSPRSVLSGIDLLDWGTALAGKPTAYIAYSDRVAFEFIGCAADRGIRIPEDISLIGADGEEFGALIRPALTSIRQPDTGQGAAAVTLLLEKIRHGKAENIVMQPELLVRSSVAPRNGKTKNREI